MARQAVTLDEWQVVVGSITITPTIMQKTIRRWLQSMGKSPVAVAEALGIGVAALQSWLKNSRTIPRSKVARFCEAARNADKFPIATAKELMNEKLDAEMRAAATTQGETNPKVTEHWPRMIRLFMRIKDKKISSFQLEKLTGVNSASYLRWAAHGCTAVTTTTAHRLKIAVEKHREWKRTHKKEITEMASPKTKKPAPKPPAAKKPPLMETLEETVLNAVPNSDAQVRAVQESARDESAMAASVVVMRHIVNEAIDKHDEVLSAAQDVARENIRLRDQADQLMNHIEKIEKEKKDMEKKMQDSEQTQNEQTEKLKNDLTEAENEIKGLKELNERLREQVKGFQQENTRLLTELEEAEARAEKAEPAPVENDAEQPAELRAQIAELKNQNDNLRGALSALTAKYNEDCDLFREMFMRRYRDREAI